MPENSTIEQVSLRISFVHTLKQYLYFFSFLLCEKFWGYFSTGNDAKTNQLLSYRRLVNLAVLVAPSFGGWIAGALVCFVRKYRSNRHNVLM